MRVGPLLSDCPLGDTLFGGPSAGDMERLAGEGAGVGRPDPAGEAPATEAATAVLLLLLLLVLLLILFDEVVVVELGTVMAGLPLFLVCSEFSAALIFSWMLDIGAATEEGVGYLCCCNGCRLDGGPYA